MVICESSDNLNMAPGSSSVARRSIPVQLLYQWDEYNAGMSFMKQKLTLHAIIAFAKWHHKLRVKEKKVGCYWALWQLQVTIAEYCDELWEASSCSSVHSSSLPSHARKEQLLAFLIRHKDLWFEKAESDGEQDPKGWAMFYLGVTTWVSISNSNSDAVLVWLYNALDNADGLDLVEQALTILADVFLHLGNYEKAIEFLTAIQESPCVDAGNQFDAMVKLSVTLAMNDNLGGADQVIERMERLASDAFGNDKVYIEAVVSKLRATISYMACEYAKCERENRRAVELFARLPTSMQDCYLEYMDNADEEAFPPHRRIRVVEFSLCAWKEIVTCDERLVGNDRVPRLDKENLVKALAQLGMDVEEVFLSDDEHGTNQQSSITRVDSEKLWELLIEYEADEFLQTTYMGITIALHKRYLQAKQHLKAKELDRAVSVAREILELSSERGSISDDAQALILLSDILMEAGSTYRRVIERLLLRAEVLMRSKPRNHRVVLNELGGYYFRTSQWRNAVCILEQYGNEFVTWECSNGSSSSRRLEYADSAKEVFHCLQVALLALERPDVRKALVWTERERARDLIYSLSSRREVSPSTFDTHYDVAWEEIGSICESAGEHTVFLIYTVQWLGDFVNDDYNLLSYLVHAKHEPRYFMREAISIQSYLYGLGRLMDEREGVDTQTIHDFLHELYKILVEPWWDALQEIAPQRLVIIPSDVVSLVPFAALVTRRGQDSVPDEYLIQKYMVSTAPSLRMFKQCQERKKQLSSRICKAVVVGNPDNSLVSAAEEAEDVMHELTQAGASVVYLGNHSNNQSAVTTTPQKLLEELKGSDWGHVASHVVIDDAVPQGGIVLWDDKTLTEEDDEKRRVVLSAQEIEEARVILPTKAVILSGCSSGLGINKSEGTLGLPRSLHLSGVPTVVASLWNVNSKYTKELMKRFYKELLENPSEVARALHLAMKSMAEQMDDFEEEREYKVYHWAPFFCSGF